MESNLIKFRDLQKISSLWIILQSLAQFVILVLDKGEILYLTYLEDFLLELSYGKDYCILPYNILN